MKTIRPTHLIAVLVLLGVHLGVVGVAAGNHHGEIERLRRAQDFVAAIALAVEELPTDPTATPAAAAAFNLVSSLAYEGADHFMARIANRSALALAEKAGAAGRADLAEALLMEAMLDRRNGVRNAIRGRRMVTRLDMESRLDRLAAMLADYPDSHRIRGQLLQFRANVVRTYSGSASALPYYEAAADYRRNRLPRPSLEVADNLVWLAWNLNEAGRSGDMLPVLDEAEAELQALGLTDHSLMGVILEFRFDRAAAAGDLATCRRLAEREAAIQVKARAGHSFGDARLAHCPLNGFRRLTWAALQMGDEETAFRAWSRTLAPTTGEYLRLGRQMEELPPTERAQISDLYLRMAAAVDRVEAVPGTPQFEDALEALRTWSELQVRIRDLENTHPAAEVTVADVQQALGADQAVVGQLVMEFGGRMLEDGTLDRLEVWMVVVRPHHPVCWIRVQGIAGDALDAQVRADNRITETLRRAALWPTRLAADPDLEQGLKGHADRVLRPVLPHLDGVSTLINIGSPMSVIMAYCTEAPRAVIRTPSLETLVTLTQGDSGPVPGDNGLLVGVATGRPDLAVISPDEEMGMLRELLPNAMELAGGDATLERIMELEASGALAAVDHAHFVAHMEVARTPRRNAIILTDGLLEAGTVFFSTQLRPRNLVLSGCSSLGGGGHTWNEYHGFAQLMLGAGVRRVVASRWDVDDRATALFMGRYYRHLLGKDVPRHPPALALAEAASWLRNWRDKDGERPFAHPVYWAGFVIYGVP